MALILKDDTQLSLNLFWNLNKIRLFWFGYFTLHDLSPKGVCDIFDWCETNLPNRTKVYNWGHNQWEGHMRRIIFKEQLRPGSMIIYVKNKNDAMAFKLRWL